MKPTQTTEQIEALAATLNEVDLCLIIRAKTPASLKGHLIGTISLSSRGREGAEPDICMHASGECVVSHYTFAEAAAALERELPETAAERAERKRAEAARLIEEARQLESSVE